MMVQCVGVVLGGHCGPRASMNIYTASSFVSRSGRSPLSVKLITAGGIHLSSLGLLGLLGLVLLHRLRGSASIEQRLVLLLSLDERVLEGVGVYY